MGADVTSANRGATVQFMCIAHECCAALCKTGKTLGALSRESGFYTAVNQIVITAPKAFDIFSRLWRSP